MSKQELFCEKNGKLHTWHTIITGFAFLTTSLAWAVYDPYVTKILNKILSESAWVDSLSQAIAKAVPWIGEFAASQGESTVSAAGGFTLVPLFIGFIMTFDNIFGVIFQPTFGKLSDRCRSKLGKCRPFVVYGAPVSAILFALIPIVALNVKDTLTLPATMFTIILFVFSMSIWRAPAVALMPALTPPHLRSEGNAIINLMGGVGSAVAMLAGTLAIALCGLFTGLSKDQITANEQVSFPYVFAIGAVVMILGMLVVRFFVKEPSSLQNVAAKNQYADEKAAKKAEKAARKAEKLSKGERKSLLFMLGCLFFLFCGSNAITTFFSLFAEEILHMITAEASRIMLVFVVCTAAAAIPAGKMGKKLGRKKTILIGLSIFLSAFVVFFGVFMVMLSNQGLSVDKYVASNNAYIAVDKQMNEYNAILIQEAEKNNTDAKVLTMDGYVAYLETGAEAEKYADFDEQLKETYVGNSKVLISDHVVKVATENFGAEGNGTFKDAMATINDSVNKVTKILNILIYPVLVLGGAANMFITVNTLPLVLEIGGIDKVGTFTGYYYTATFSAQIASPILYGFIRMFAGTYMSLFYYSPICFALGIFMIFFVKHGEAIPQEIVDKIEEENAD
ncbi:MAG: MFS transporter [Clostridia bacterium]|nr:MFS transporter [Clostridia bacterium]